jgi:hypothetical protein
VGCEATCEAAIAEALISHILKPELRPMPLFIAKFADGSTLKVGGLTMQAAGVKAAQIKKQVVAELEPIVDYWDVGGGQASDAVLHLRYTMPPCMEAVRRAASICPTKEPGQTCTLNEMIFTLGNVFQRAVDCGALHQDQCLEICRWVGRYKGNDPGDLIEAIWFDRGGW